jgi:hypothetical protein
MRFGWILAPLLLATPMQAQHMNHADHSGGHSNAQASTQASETGQGAFAAIQEIVAILEADPHTDWSKVDIDALRAHLVDMDNVTMHAKVKEIAIKGGVAFQVVSEDPEVIGSIQRMVVAHAAVMNGVNGLEMKGSARPYGALLGVEGDVDRIKGLGFFGIMATGMHHQAHHMAIARGGNPHH